MKRTEFIKNLALSLGGTTLFACESDLIDSLLPKAEYEILEIDEAKDFFEKDYMKRFSNFKINGENHHNRKAKWEKAFKEKKKKKNENDKDEEFVVVPIEYDENKFPAIMMYTDETKYLEKIPRAGSLPIKEYLIVYKNKNKNEAFLAQVCAHPSDNIPIINNSVELAAFTGLLIKADWEDKPATGFKYEKGQLKSYFDTNSNINAKVQDCFMTYYGYQTVTIQPCSGNYGITYSGACLEAVYTYYTSINWVCTNYATFDPYSPYFYYPNYTSGGNSSGGNSISPLLDTRYYPNNSQGFNTKRVVCNVGDDRQKFNNIIASTTSALGLVADISGFSLDKAEAISRSLGASLNKYAPVAGQIGRKIGYAGILLDGYQLGIGLKDGTFDLDLNSDLGNAAQLALGVGAIFVGPWVAVAFGAVSIGIAVYQAANTPPPTCN